MKTLRTLLTLCLLLPLVALAQYTGGQGRGDVMVGFAPFNSWTQKANFGGFARASAVGFSIGTKGYIGLGYDANGIMNDFWEFDPTANTWTQKANFAGGPRSGAVGFGIGTKGYIGTGHDGSYKNDFWEYDPTANSWTQKANCGGAPRTAAGGFIIGSKGYIGLGYDGISDKNDLWEYDPTADTWTQKANFGGTARSHPVGFSIGSKGYMGTGYSGYPRNDFWEYDPTADTWTQKADIGGSARYIATGFSIGTKGYIGAGAVGYYSHLNDFWAYDPVTNTWTQKANVGGTVRAFAVGFSIGSKGYVGTGDGGSFGYNVKNDFWEYMTDVPDCNGVAGGPNIPGSACNDANACTTNDVYTMACACIGTALPDTDGDGNCDVTDGCPNDPNKQNPGTCGCGYQDDGNNNTIPDCEEGCMNALASNYDPTATVSNSSCLFCEGIQDFSSAVTLAVAQTPNAWYPDRYTPNGFTAQTSFGGNDRLLHHIDAADCATCRPGAFSGAFYNTQGRKYDLGVGATAMEIQLYIPSAWASTGRRMAGFWGSAVDNTNAVSFYPIIEFTSTTGDADGSGARFRVWDGVSTNGWTTIGLPSGFAYDSWHTLHIKLVNGHVTYTVGDLVLTLAANGALRLDNAILQGHNTSAGVSYDIHWDNFQQWFEPTDTDGDGIGNACDQCPTAVGQIGSTCDDGNANTVNDALNASCVCVGQLLGCTDVLGQNYNPLAVVNDGSCTYCTPTLTTNTPISTPIVIGSGIPASNASVGTDCHGFEVGLTAFERYVGAIIPVGNVYTVEAGNSPTSASDPTPADGLARWNYLVSVNLGTSTFNQVKVWFDIDLDPGVGTTYAPMDVSAYMISQSLGGTSLFQDSQNRGFAFWTAAPFNFPAFNPYQAGTYDLRVRLESATTNAPLMTVPIQVVVTPVMQVAATVLLDGAYDDNTDLMRDDLRAANLIPAAQPYTAAPFSYSGTETVSPAVLGVTGDNAIVDWVLVQLRDAGTPATVLHTRAALVQRDGDVVGTDGVEPVRFTGVPDGNYHVTLLHRNHLGAMSATPLAISASSANTVDLTSASTWGTNAMKPRDGRNMLWGGNARPDDRLRYTGSSNDRDGILIAVGGFVPTATLPNVYRLEDTNLDGDVIYTGASNDRELILLNVNWGFGNTSVTRQRLQQLP